MNDQTSSPAAQADPYDRNRELNAIIEHKLTRSEILQARQAGQINSTEFLLLFSLDRQTFFLKILKGVGEYRLRYDSSVPDEAYFTHVPMLMSAFYSLYGKYPLYHFDRLFAYGLSLLCSTRFNLFEGLVLLHHHLQREQDETASFSIDAAPILRQAAALLSDEAYREICSRQTQYEAAAYEDGALGLYREYNELFVRAAGVSILPEDTNRAKTRGKRGKTR